MKKIITIITLAGFLTCSVFGELLHASTGADAAENNFSELPDGFIVPPSVGKVTGFWPAQGSPSCVVVNIQDLHCHAEVQRNIAKILSALDVNYGLERVYVEGGCGDISTAWLEKITGARSDKPLYGLMDNGIISGSEFYSATAGRPDLLCGLEDKFTHRRNIARLGAILENKPAYVSAIKAYERELGFLKNKFLSSQNKELDKIVTRRRLGKIKDAQYYGLLVNYARRINAETYPADYPDIAAFIELASLQEKLNYAEISRQCSRFVADVKSRLTYGEYNSLLDKTGNFSQTEQLYFHLAGLADHEALKPLAGRYRGLYDFFACIRKSAGLNPVAIIDEERRLLGQIRLAFSRDTSEVDVVFLTDFFSYFRDYLNASISAADYAYFRTKFEKFRSTWDVYAFKPVDDAGFKLLDDYYEANIVRNEYFIANSCGDARLTGEPAQIAAASEILPRDLLNNCRIITLVTGGFHTAGINKLLRERNIPYITITPNATTGGEAAGLIYSQLAARQARSLGKSIANSGLESLALALGPENIGAVSVSDDKISIEYGGEPLTLVRNGNGEFKIMQPAVRTSVSSGFTLDTVAFESVVNEAIKTVSMADAIINPRRTAELIYMLIKFFSRQAAAGGVMGGDGLIWKIATDPEVQKVISRNESIPLDELSRLPDAIQQVIANHAGSNPSLQCLTVEALFPPRKIARRELVESAQKYLNLLSETEGDDFTVNPPDVFLLLGQPQVRVYTEFAKKWKEIKQKTGVSVPVVVAGGFGRGTYPLITRVLQHYGDKISGNDKEWMQRSLDDGIDVAEKITEADVMMIVLKLEGVSCEIVREEKSEGAWSKNTLQNFLFTRNPIAGIVAGRSNPSVAVVTRPDLLLRAYATASGAWLDDIEAGGWQVKRCRMYDVDAAQLSDDELIELVGYTAGYPAKYLEMFFRGTPFFYNYTNSEIRGITIEHNETVAKIPDSSQASKKLAEYVRKGVPLRDDVKARLEKFLDTGDVAIDRKKNTLCFKEESSDEKGASGGMFGISRNALIIAVRMAAVWEAKLSENAADIAGLVFELAAVEAAGIRKKHVYSSGDIGRDDLYVYALLDYWNKLRLSERKRPVDHIIISEADSDIIVTGYGLGLAGMFEASIDGVAKMRCARCRTSRERVALLGHEIAEYLAIHVESSWHYKALDHYLGENRFARLGISQRELVDHWHSCQRHIVDHPDTMLPLFVGIDEKSGFIISHITEDVKRFNGYMPSLAKTIAGLVVRTVPDSGLFRHFTVITVAIESALRNYFRVLTPSSGKPAGRMIKFIFISLSPLMVFGTGIFAAFHIDAAPAMAVLNGLFGSDATILVMVSVILYNLLYGLKKIVNLSSLLVFSKLKRIDGLDDGRAMLRVLNLAEVFRAHESKIILSSAIIALVSVAIQLTGGPVYSVLVAPLVINSVFWIWLRYEMWITNAVLLLNGSPGKHGNDPAVIRSADAGAAVPDSPREDVYLDYNYGIAAESRIGETIKLLEALFPDSARNLHTNIYIINRNMEGMDAYGWKNVGINVDGRQLWASARPGALVLFADGADVRDIAAGIDDKISDKGTMPGSRRLDRNLKDMLASLDVDIKTKKLKPGITIDWSSNDRIMSYAANGSLVVSSHFFIDDKGIIDKEALATVLGDMIAVRNADSFAVARSNGIHLDVDAGMEVDSIRDNIFVQNAAHSFEHKNLNVSNEDLASLLTVAGDIRLLKALEKVNIGCVSLYFKKIEIELGGTPREKEITVLKMAFSRAVVERLLALKKLGAARLADHNLEVILGQNLLQQELLNAGNSGVAITPDAFLSDAFYGQLNVKVMELCKHGNDPMAINAVVELILAHAERKTVQREEMREKLLNVALLDEMFKAQ